MVQWLTTLRSSAAQYAGLLIRYARLMAWVVGDCIVRFRWASLVVLVASVGSSALMASAIGVVVTYARGLEQGRTIQFLGEEYAFRSSYELLLTVSVGVAVVMIASAGALYLAQVGAIRLGVRYQNLIMTRVLCAYAKGAGPSAPPAGEPMSIFHIVKRDARYCNIVCRKLLSTIAPLATCLFAFAVLLWLHLTLTAIIFVLVLAGSHFLVRLGRRGAQHMTDVQQAARPATRRIGDVVRWCTNTPQMELSPEQCEAWTTQYVDVRAWNESFMGRMTVIEGSSFVSSVLYGLAISLMLIALGPQIIEEGQGWARLLAYLMFLRMAMTNTRLLAVHLTAINRFYRSIQRYRRAVEWFSTTGSPASRTLSRIELGPKPSLGGETEVLTVKRGEPVAVLSPLKPDRLEGAELIRALAPTSSDRVQWAFANASPDLPPRELLPDLTVLGEDAEALLADCPMLRRYWRSAAETLANADGTTEGLGASLNLTERAALSLILAMRTRPAVLILKREVLMVEPEVRSEILAWLRDVVVLVVYRTVEAVDCDVCGAVVVTDATCVRALFGVQEFEQLSETVRGRLNRMVGHVARQRGDVLGDEDEEVM